MLIFCVFVLILLFVVCRFPMRNATNHHAFIVVGVLSIYWGFEYINAPDMEGYMEMYKLISSDFSYIYNSLATTVYENFEPGFLYLASLIKRLSDNYYVFQFFLLITELSLIYKGISKSANPEIAIFSLCICAFIIPSLLAAMRQGLAISLFIYSFSYIIERKYIKTFLIYIIGAFFHFSIVAMIFVPIIYWNYHRIINNDYCAFFKSQWFKIVFLLFLNVLYISEISFLSKFGDVLYGLEVGKGSTGQSYVIADAVFDTDGFGIKKILEMDLCYLLVFWGKWKENSYRTILTIIFIFYFIINAGARGIIVHRFGYYCLFPYYFLFFLSMLNLHKNDIKVQRSYSLIMFSYMAFLFIWQSLVNGDFIFEYKLLSLFL